MLKNKSTWVLIDSRTGNNNQSLALASLLDLKYKSKQLMYNFLGEFPNWLGFGLLTLKNKRVLLSDTLPDIVISAGRRCAAIAAALKQIKPSLRIIQLMQPGMSYEPFDVIILPKHDDKPSAHYLPRTIFVSGAISYYPLEEQAKDRKYWQDKFADLPTPRIGVLIGGVAKGCSFTVKHAAEMMDHLTKVALSKKASLMISTSRRTPKDVLAYIKERLAKFPGKYFLNDINAQVENPFRGILTVADYLVVTGDSVSMCSEAAEMGKPLYIFFSDDQIGEKHMAFLKALFKDNIARRLTHPLPKFVLNKEGTGLEDIKSKVEARLGL